MFFLQLIFVVEKNLYIDVVDIKTGEIFVPLAIWENFSLLRDVELADYYFSDLLHIPLEVDYQLWLLLVGDELVQPVPTVAGYLRTNVLLTGYGYGADAFLH